MEREQRKKIYLQLIMDKTTNVMIMIIITDKIEHKYYWVEQQTTTTIQKINNWQVFECLTNTTPQNTTIKSKPQTHQTIQNLKCGMYWLVVSLKI